MLGVPRDADQATIKDAFRRLALRYHPDRCKEPDAEERFKEIAEAYAVLNDPKKRREYDAAGFAGVAGFTPEDLFGGIDLEDLFGGLGFDFGFGGEGLFGRFFRPRRPGPARGENIEITIEVPLERIASGGRERVRIRRPQTCPTCRGSGARPGTQPRRCATCGGSGRQVASRRDAGVTIQQITTCPGCGGRGEVIDQRCPECDGRRQVEREETLTVNIPAGVEEGMALRIPGHGFPSRDPRGEPGDLFVIVQTAPDTRFEREGINLWHRKEISIPDAVLGTTVEVPSLDGRLKVTIPPGTQPNSVLRLRGKGLPEFGGKRRGDLFVRVEVRVPERLGAEERKLWERLRALAEKEKHESIHR
ncbi:MAG TPA: DnaJ C-terminal domain-containing protein [candidate division Zixibacteria bacterium]|nr:DnaJ C-terminal domain-containing protein [candidate division Zixibacteria bacterium]